MVIGVDPGHGGYDPGVIKGDIKEKDIVLAISLFLKTYLYNTPASYFLPFLPELFS